MASGVRELLKADVAVAVTGLAGPGGDEFGHPVGTVFIGYEDAHSAEVLECHFAGDREEVRRQTIKAAVKLILSYNTKWYNYAVFLPDRKAKHKHPDLR